MPARRSPGQKALLVWFRSEFLAEIDRLFPKLGFSDRATFIREAIYEKLERAGYKVPAEYKTAPPRIGKGGKSKLIAYQTRPPKFAIVAESSKHAKKTHE